MKLLSSYLEKWSAQEAVKHLSSRQKDRHFSHQLKRVIPEMDSIPSKRNSLHSILHGVDPVSGLPATFWLLTKGYPQCAIALINFNASTYHDRRSLLRFALENKLYYGACTITDNFLDYGHEQPFINALCSHPTDGISTLKLVVSHANMGTIQNESYRKMLLLVLERFNQQHIAPTELLRLHGILKKVERGLSSKVQKFAAPLIERINILKEVGKILETIDKTKIKPKENVLNAQEPSANGPQKKNAQTIESTATSSTQILLEKQQAKLDELTKLLNNITEEECRHFETLSEKQKCLATDSNRIHQLVGQRFEKYKRTCCEFEKEAHTTIKTLKTMR